MKDSRLNRVGFSIVLLMLATFGLCCVSGCNSEGNSNARSGDPSQSDSENALQVLAEQFDAAQQKQKKVAKDLNLSVSYTNSIGMKFRLIPAGSFELSKGGMFSKDDPTEVKISRSFYLGVVEVTQEQYEKVCGNNPSHFKDPQKPVEEVIWSRANEYCKILSDLPDEKRQGNIYRLPSEFQWELACRADSKTAYHFGDQPNLLKEYSWNGKLSDGTTTVMSGKPNAWGLYDMYGNVYEWCSDWKAPIGKGPMLTDPHGPDDGLKRVARGGCWFTPDRDCRSSSRVGYVPDVPLDELGFRVLLEIPTK